MSIKSLLKIKYLIHNTILVLLLIATSGVPFFVGSYFLMPLSFIYAIYIAYIRRIKLIDSALISILLFLLSIVNLRELVHGYFPSLYENLVVILKYTFSYIVLKILAYNFIERYIKVMYYIALSSLTFFSLFNLFPELESHFRSSITPFFTISTKGGFYEYAPNFILYTFSERGRNAGPFWEPGGFVVFLTIALIFRLFQKRNLFNKQGVVLLLGLITTFSTAGYVALFFIMLAYTFSLRKRIYIYMLIPVMIIISINAYQKLDFLQNKVSTHLSTIESNYEGRVANRFTSILIDLDRIIKNPLLGNPVGASGEYTIYSHRNNGLSSMAVSYGLVYFLLYFWLVYKGFRQLQLLYGSKNRVSLILSVLAVFAFFFGQVLTDKPVVNALAMMPFILSNSYIKRLKLSISK